MQEIPNVPTMSKAEIIQQQLNEISELKKQVIEKRRALRLLGADIQAEAIKAPQPVPEPTPRPARKSRTAKTETAPIVVPPESPFFDPHAKVQVSPSVQAQIVEVKPEPVPETKPVPVPVVSHKQVPIPVNSPKSVASKPAPIKTNRVSHDGKWF